MNGSAATFSPTCFIVTMARAPPNAAPTHSSKATFSLEDQCASTSSYWPRLSSTSVLGVPG